MASCETAKFYWQQWLSKRDKPNVTYAELYRIDRTAAPPPSCMYTVTTYTSDLQGAGTEAAVAAKIIGSEGQTVIVDLTSSGSHFRRGARDDFTFKGTDVGAVQQLFIGHNNA